MQITHGQAADAGEAFTEGMTAQSLSLLPVDNPYDAVDARHQAWAGGLDFARQLNSVQTLQRLFSR